MLEYKHPVADVGIVLILFQRLSSLLQKKKKKKKKYRVRRLFGMVSCNWPDVTFFFNNTNIYSQRQVYIGAAEYVDSTNDFLPSESATTFSNRGIKKKDKKVNQEARDWISKKSPKISLMFSRDTTRDAFPCNKISRNL